jgi:hypothetical protein
MCILLERTKDTGFIPELIKLLKSDDVEMRFHAGFTLGRLTRHAIRFNAYWKKERRDSAIKEYESWWEKNKDTFKIE